MFQILINGKAYDMELAKNKTVADVIQMLPLRENYSLWGGSAGARLCSYVTYLGSGFIKPDMKLHPAADIIAYTYFDFKPRFMPEDSPGFFITGTRDWLVPVSSTKTDADGLKKQGVPVEVHAPEGAEHGFGVGNGTPAEGWISQAIDFWKRNMK